MSEDAATFIEELRALSIQHVMDHEMRTGRQRAINSFTEGKAADLIEHLRAQLTAALSSRERMREALTEARTVFEDEIEGPEDNYRILYALDPHVGEISEDGQEEIAPYAALVAKIDRALQEDSTAQEETR